jgi:hypothetical protein
MPTREALLASLTREGRFELVPDTSNGYPIRVYRHAPASFRDVLAPMAGAPSPSMARRA